MFGIIKIFIVLLSDIVNGSNFRKCVSLSNQYFSNNIYTPNKTENWNLMLFNIITSVNELIKTLPKLLSWEYKCRFDGRKCNSDEWWNNDQCSCECDVNSTFDCKNGKYFASITDNSRIMCDKVIESYGEDVEAKSYDQANFNEKKSNCKMLNFHILPAFLLITIALLIPVSICCYLIKYRAILKHLLLLHFADNKSKI